MQSLEDPTTYVVFPWRMNNLAETARIHRPNPDDDYSALLKEE
jgi:hypothetical protein